MFKKVSLAVLLVVVLGFGGFFYLHERNTRQAVNILDRLQYMDNIIVENQEVSR